MPIMAFSAVIHTGGLTHAQAEDQFIGHITTRLVDPDQDTEVTVTIDNELQVTLEGSQSDILEELNDLTGHTWESPPTEDPDNDYGSDKKGGDQDNDVPTLLSIRSHIALAIRTG